MPFGRWNAKPDAQSARAAVTDRPPEPTDRRPPQPEPSGLPDVTPELVERLQRQLAQADSESAITPGKLRSLARLLGVSSVSGRTETDAPCR